MADHISLTATTKPLHLDAAEFGELPNSAVFHGPGFLHAEAEVSLLAADPTKPNDPTQGDAQYNADIDQGFKTVYVIGLNDTDKGAIKETAENVQDYLTYLTGCANAKVSEKIKSGAIKSGDYAKQSDYRARLMNALILSTKGFLAIEADVGFNHRFSCKTVELHVEILKTLFKGLAVPSSLLTSFESLFDSLKDSVVKFSSQSTVDDKHIFLIVKSFVKNDLGIVDTKIRLFLFKLTDQVREIAVGKSSYKSIDISIEFDNLQYQWNDKVYKDVKKSLSEQLKEDGKASLAKLPNVDVDI